MNSDKKIQFRVSHIIILINGILFLCMLVYDFFSKGLTDISQFGNISIPTLMIFGAKYNFNIVDGEYYRLFTTMFLHANVLHILFNMGALHVLGRDLEYFFGKKKFLVLYLGSGILGSIGSFLFNHSVGVGASGAIFGLLGAHIYLFLKNKEVYKRIYGKDIFVLIGINLIYGFISSNIDNAAHIAGLLGGVLMAFSLGLSKESLLEKRKLPFQIGTTAILILFFVFGIPHYMNTPDYYWDKGVSLIMEEDVEGAKGFFQEGFRLAPQEKRFEEILQQIELFETQN